MRFTEHELTLAVQAAAKSVAAARGRTRRRAEDAEAVWETMSRYERYQVMDAVGTQVLPVLAVLPEVEVEPGTRPSFTNAQVLAAVEQTMGEGKGRLRRKVAAASVAVLVQSALAELPPRQDPDALIVPDHL